MKVLEGLLYSEDHEWIKVEGNKATIGISDYAQHALGSIVYVELPEEDDELDKDEDFGVIESVKAASDMKLPVSGTVVEVNEALEDTPGMINEKPYESWICVVELSDLSELDELFGAAAYEKFIAKED